MDFEQSKRSGWLVVSEFVGTYNSCWSFDIHIFYDKNKKKINHLNIHHTAKIAVIPNDKAAFFLISNFIHIRFSFHHFNIWFVFFFELDVRFSFYYFFLFGLDVRSILFYMFIIIKINL